MRATEIQPRKLVIFDIDDTLVHTQTKVHVVQDGRVIKSLNSHDFTHYKLQSGQEFDFGAFRNAREFFHNSKPIIPMMNQLKQDIATGNKVVMVTARADFDDRELFLDTFRKYGVDMNKVHVYRAGNMAGKMQTEEKKKIIIRELLNSGRYTKAIMYDDAVPNLDAFLSLHKEYPHTKFYAWHVSLEGETSEHSRSHMEEDWNKVNHHDKTDGLSQKAVNAYRRENPGSKLKTAVTTKPSKLKAGSKDAKRRKSFCARMSGNKGPMKKPNGKPTPKALALRRWNCESIEEMQELIMSGESYIANLKENFADGKNPQDKGDSKRHGVPTKASVSTLRKVAHQGGRKGQLAHWMANMKSGKAKHAGK
jgi:FMN phosphatase YigB (HAD superfamily)